MSCVTVEYHIKCIIRSYTGKALITHIQIWLITLLVQVPQFHFYSCGIPDFKFSPPNYCQIVLSTLLYTAGDSMDIQRQKIPVPPSPCPHDPNSASQMHNNFLILVLQKTFYHASEYYIYIVTFTIMRNNRMSCLSHIHFTSTFTIMWSKRGDMYNL